MHFDSLFVYSWLRKKYAFAKRKALSNRAADHEICSITVKYSSGSDYGCIISSPPSVPVLLFLRLKSDTSNLPNR